MFDVTPSCFYLGERGERVGPPDPTFLLLIALAHVSSGPGKNF